LPPLPFGVRGRGVAYPSPTPKATWRGRQLGGGEGESCPSATRSFGVLPHILRRVRQHPYPSPSKLPSPFGFFPQPSPSG